MFVSQADKAKMAVSHSHDHGLGKYWKQKKSEPDCAVKARDSRSRAKGSDFEDARLKLRAMAALCVES